MKKITSCTLALAMVLTILQAGVLNASAELSGDYNYSVVNNSTVTINFYLGTGGFVKIPAEIGGYPVTVIGTQAFSSQSSITGISIPNTVTVIGQESFKGCINLTRVTVPASVTEIQMWAFKDCSNLAKVYFLDNAPIMGIRPFEGCKAPAIFRVYYISGNTNFTSPWNGFTTETFTPLSGLPTLAVDTTTPTTGPVKVTITYPKADETLQEYKIDNGVWFAYVSPVFLSANATVYARCSDAAGNSGNSASIYVGNIAVNGIIYTLTGNTASVTSYIGTGGALNIPATLGGFPVTDIGPSAFQNKTSLTSVVIPDSVSNISTFAFSGCSGLTSLTIGKNVSVIGNSAFKNCSGLTTLNIPDKVWSLSESAFWGCAGLTRVNFGSGVETIMQNTFRECTNLTRVILPDNLKSINGYAFYGCTKLANIVIPEKVSAIGQEAFKGCTLLANVYFMGNSPTLETLVFDSCAVGFKGYYLSGKSGFVNPWYTYTTAVFTPYAAPTLSASSAVNTNGTVTVTIAYPNGKAETYQNNEYRLTNKSWSIYTAPVILTSSAVVVAGYTDTLGKPSLRGSLVVDNIYEFEVTVSNSAINITKYIGSGGAVTIPTMLNNLPVTSIGNYAFLDCAAVTGVIISTGVTSIGDNTFKGCLKLASVSLPAGLLSIGSSAFFGCEDLSSVFIPSSVLSIGRSAFSACSSISNIFVDDANTNYASLDGVLFNKTKTTLLQYPAGSSESYTVPAGVTTIFKNAFANSPEFYEITILRSVTTIAEFAFDNCVNLTIYCTGTSTAHTYAQDNDIPFVIIGAYLAGISGRGTVIDTANGFIYGLASKISKAQFESLYVLINGNARLVYTPAATPLGTGVKVELVDNTTNQIWESYKIVIYGDVNGDGNIDSLDAGRIVDVENSAYTWDPAANAAVIEAAHVNSDENIDSMDAGIVVDFENHLSLIDQSRYEIIG